MKIFVKRLTPGLRHRDTIGDWGLEIGDWRLKIGGWRLETGDWRLENRRADSLPAAVEMPAPVMTTIRFARPLLISSATAAMLRSESVSGRVSSDTKLEVSWPMLKRRGQREFDACWCRAFFLRPMFATLLAVFWAGEGGAHWQVDRKYGSVRSQKIVDFLFCNDWTGIYLGRLHCFRYLHVGTKYVGT